MTTSASSTRLILASASPARRKLLEDSRIAFTVRVSSVDEDAALEHLKAASRKLDKAVSKGVIHKNQAANRKSKLAKRVASL